MTHITFKWTRSSNQTRERSFSENNLQIINSGREQNPTTWELVK